MKSSRTWLAMPAAALAVAAIVAAIVLLTHASPPQPDQGDLDPTAIPTNSRTTGPVEARDVTVPVYFVSDTTAGARLFREVRAYQGVIGWTKLRVAVTSALLGDTTDPDYRSAFPKGTTAHVSQIGETVIVDISANLDLTSVNVYEGDAGVQAVVHTVDAVLHNADPVQFRVNGSNVNRLLGVDTSQPVRRETADLVLAPVWLLAPDNQSDVRSPFRVTGMAATFEAKVLWELKDGTRVVRRGSGTTKKCCTQSPFSFAVTAPPGNYTLVVHDTSKSSTGDLLNFDSREITVR
jgi:hypothetical protein